MKRSRATLLDGDPLRFDRVERPIAIPESPGIPEWRGRFWLPDSTPIQLGGKSCLIPDDGQPGKRIVAGFGPGAPRGKSPDKR